MIAAFVASASGLFLTPAVRCPAMRAPTVLMKAAKYADYVKEHEGDSDNGYPEGFRSTQLPTETNRQSRTSGGPASLAACCAQSRSQSRGQPPPTDRLETVTDRPSVSGQRERPSRRQETRVTTTEGSARQ